MLRRLITTYHALSFCSSWYLSHSPRAISIILWLIDWSQPQVAWKSLLSWMPPMICFKPVKMLTTMPPLRPTFLLLTKSFFLSKKGNYNWFYFMSRFSVLDCSYLYIGLFAALWIWLLVAWDYTGLMICLEQWYRLLPSFFSNVVP